MFWTVPGNMLVQYLDWYLQVHYIQYSEMTMKHDSSNTSIAPTKWTLHAVNMSAMGNYRSFLACLEHM